jgi:endonuclease YncB( thermonuclease family)
MRRAILNVIRHAVMLAVVALAAAAPARAAGTFPAKVVAVVDGDTLVVRDDRGRRHEIRIAGVDAPEIRQAYGVRSRARLAELVYGKRVSVAWYKHDRYDRVLAHVWVNGGQACSAPPCAPVDVGHAQIAAGLAWHDKEHLDEQGAEERVRYARAEQAARARRTGLWAEASPLPPWRYRHRYRNPEDRHRYPAR